MNIRNLFLSQRRSGFNSPEAAPNPNGCMHEAERKLGIIAGSCGTSSFNESENAER